MHQTSRRLTGMALSCGRTHCPGPRMASRLQGTTRRESADGAGQPQRLVRRRLRTAARMWSSTGAARVTARTPRRRGSAENFKHKPTVGNSFSCEGGERRSADSGASRPWEHKELPRVDATSTFCVGVRWPVQRVAHRRVILEDNRRIVSCQPPLEPCPILYNRECLSPLFELERPVPYGQHVAVFRFSKSPTHALAVQRTRGSAAGALSTRPS